MAQFCARLATAIYKLLGIHKLTTSVYHPSGNGGVERVNHTMAQMLAMVCNEHQNDWDVHLPHVEYAYNNSVSAATGLAPNEIHMGRLPRLPLAIFDRSYGGTHQNLDRDQLAYCDLARERQQRAYELVREQHALTVARVNGRNSALSDALLRRPQYAAGGWVWVYNTAATIRQGLRKGADNKILKEKLSLNWTGPFKIIAVGPAPAADTPDGRPLGDKLLYLDLPSNLSGPAAKPRVTVARCKPCANPYDADDIPRHLPAGLTQYVLHAFATKSPPYHVTTDDVSTPPILIDVAKITGHQCVRGRGGAIAVLYETHWNGILRPHGNGNWISRPSDTSFLPIGRMVRNTTNPILDNTNSCVLTPRRARSPAPRANATSRVLTGLSLPTSTEPASYPPLCLSEPLSGTTLSTAPGGSAKSCNLLTPPAVTSYDSLTIQVPP